MLLPFDRDLVDPEPLLEWIGELGVAVEFERLDRYPRRPLILSSYQHEPPLIRIYQYLPVEDQFNLICQRQAGYYGPWFCLHLAYRLYYYLETEDLYELPLDWRSRLFGGMQSLDERAYAFAKDLLGCRYNPARFDSYLDSCFQPGGSFDL